jgi:transposase
MQGKKKFTPKLFHSIDLQSLVPENNFYCRLNKLLGLHWLYKATKEYYGTEGQQSIDPVVFFKICLIGYLNGIHSDRKLIEFCKDSLSIRLFLGYDIDEELPWHSTISRTRHLYSEEEFKELFEAVFSMCADSGMVSGKTQAIDGALLKANASKDSLEVKQVNETIEEYLLQNIKANSEARRPAKNDKASGDDKKMKGDDEEQRRDLNELNTRYKRQEQNYKDMPGDDKGKYLSNKTHYSPTDPESRIAVKPGKPRDLYYNGQIAVDTKRHVITHAQTFKAEGKDGWYLKQIIEQTKQRLQSQALELRQCLADAAYSSGENYTYLKEHNIEAYIPLLGGALSGSEGFVYDEENDWYVCPNNKVLKGSGRVVDDGRGHPVKKYFSLKSDCDKCPIRSSCITEKAKTKKVQHSIYKKELEEAITRQRSIKGKIMKRRRSATVEPVWGTLINFLGLRRMTSRGLKCANQALLMAAACYNLKKYMKHVSKKVKTMAIALPKPQGQAYAKNFFFQWLLLIFAGPKIKPSIC